MHVCVCVSLHACMLSQMLSYHPVDCEIDFTILNELVCVCGMCASSTTQNATNSSE